MKKKIIFSVFLFSSGLFFSQVGINNTNPKATLHITAKSGTGTSTNPEGILIPAVDRERAQSMNGVEISTLIFVNNINTGSQTGTAVNIDETGFYFFNGGVWQPIQKKESWLVQGTILPATENNQDIYHSGSISLEKDSAYSNGNSKVTFDVEGTLRSGSNQKGAIGVNSVALGNNNEASGDYSVALGNGISAKNTAETVIGQYNKVTDGSVFSVGTGDGESTRANVITAVKKAPAESWVAIGSGTQIPTQTSNNEKLRVYGGTVTDSAFVTNINNNEGSKNDHFVVADSQTGQLQTISLQKTSVPLPVVLRLKTDQVDFLKDAHVGDLQVIDDMEIVANSVEGFTFDPNTSIVTMPPGIYQITLIYEATHNAACNISSYFVDFPTSDQAVRQRIHSTAYHNQNNLSNHGGSITYVTAIPTQRTWTIRLGRGQSGDCNGLGMTLDDQSTQVLFYRLGDTAS